MKRGLRVGDMVAIGIYRDADGPAKWGDLADGFDLGIVVRVTQQTCKIQWFLDCITHAYNWRDARDFRSEYLQYQRLAKKNKR